MQQQTSWGWARAHPRLRQLAWSYQLLRVELEIQFGQNLFLQNHFFRINFVLEKICPKGFSQKHRQNLCFSPPPKKNLFSPKNCWPKKILLPPKIVWNNVVPPKKFVKKNLSKKINPKMCGPKQFWFQKHLVLKKCW